MKIIVCIKQVPDTNDVKWSKENTIIREGLINIINPYDEYAIQAALDIKKINPDSEITLLSMGPQCAKEVLEYGLALGADSAVHLCDKRFSGADTKATSKTLAAAIKNVIKDYDIIIAGQFAIDGDTAQTGPSLACQLNLPVLTFVKSILDADNEKITARCEGENEIITMETTVPCVLCVLKNNKEIKNPKIQDYINAQNKKIKSFNIEEIELNPDEAGIKGSPTFVQRAFKPEIKRWVRKVKYNYAKEILSHIREENGKEIRQEQ